MNTGRLLVFLALLGAALYLAWQRLPPLPEHTVAAPAADAWQLPEAHRADVAAAWNAFTERMPWGSVSAGFGERPEPDPAWSLAGTMRRGGERYLLLRIEGQPTRHMAVGDRLPGDHEILAIHDDTVCVRVNKQHRLLRVFER